MITTSSSKHNAALCVCIPTYNRADRLDKSLHDLLGQICATKSREKISVYISDNGSKDHSAKVIQQHQVLYAAENISLSYDLWPDNQGFDINVLSCYENGKADYLWLLSDDDNIFSGALEQIVEDIETVEAGVHYYNFQQSPYGLDNPWVKEKAIYLTFESHEAVSKVVHWPKLSAIVIKKGDGASGIKAAGLRGAKTCGFMHVALALQATFDSGKLLLSNRFIAHPDPDYMDHIDFPPYIFNSLNDIMQEICNANGKAHLIPALQRRYVSPLNSSLRWLASYYFGQMMLTPTLRNRLQQTVSNGLRESVYLKNAQLGFIKATIIFVFAYGYFLIRKILTGKRGARDRSDHS